MTPVQQFEAFLQNHQNMVFSTAMRLVANHAEAEDISQEVFLRAYDHFHELADNPRAVGWLKTVATNLSLNHLARYRSRWSFFSELLRPGDDDTESMDFPAPETDDLDRRDQSALVEKALQQLPPAQRVPMVLFHLDGLSYEEIAARLNISLGKVKTDIHRGRKSLRARLERLGGGERIESSPS
ncbi:MAG: RNA polymerase sigma factor [Verrucomicrobiota bacterium]